MKKEMISPNTLNVEREFSFRAILFGVLIGVVLMALMMYLDAVLGLDTNVAPIASMIGVLFIPLFGGPTNRREVIMMQTCATATTFAAYSLTGNMVPLLMMGEKLEIIPTFILLLLADVIGVCFVTILRDQFVYDQNLPFPNAIMCTTALDQIDEKDNRSTKLLFGAIAFSVVISLLQNLEFLPITFDFSSYMPVKGMILGALIMPLMLGMGYVIGSKNAIYMLVTSLLVGLFQGPLGTRLGWFANPAEGNFSQMQNFNLPIVVGVAILAALIPMGKEWKSIARTFQFKKSENENTDRDYSMKPVLIWMFFLVFALIAFCNFYYGIKIIHLIICMSISLIFAMIAIRVKAESGLSAGLALNIFMMLIAYVLTGSAVFSVLIAFMNFNTFMLAQDTMLDLKVGQIIGASPIKQIKAQLIGVVVGCIAGTALFYAIIKVFGLNNDLFTFPFGNMYYSIISGISEGGVSELFNPIRFVIGGALGTILSFVGLPAGGIALAMYLAPRTIIGIALGGVIRFIVEKAKGMEFAERMNNVATGLVIGDAMVCILMVIITIVRV